MSFPTQQVLSRLLPVIVVIASTYLVPWYQRGQLIHGKNGKNFAQTDVSRCTIVHPDTLIGCEDLHVYKPHTGEVEIFAGCAEKLEDQLTWFPAITARNASKPGYYKGPWYTYQPATDKVTKLEISNFPENTDRVWHGFDIHEVSPTEILIYAINHRRTGSMIEKLRHKVGSSELVYEKSFDCHNDIVYTPNDVAVVGEDAFFVTNDHVDVDGYLRALVDFFTLPLTTVAYHDPKTGFKIAAKNIKGANGIVAEKPGNHIFVSGIIGGEMLVYERNATGDLKFIQPITLDFLPDNPSITPGNDLLVTGIPVTETAFNHDPSVAAHSKVVRIPLSQLGDKYFGGGSGRTAPPVVENVLMDATGKLNGSTTSVEVWTEDGTEWLISTSWRSVGLTKCKL